jgi:two-component system cell cycle sensor histidine kinase/response regulator CckA
MPDRGTIPVIDDAPEICEQAQAILEASGFRVLTATDGVAGVTLFRQHAEDIRVVLLDLIMPVMPGEMVLREIQQMRPRVPVILLTGLAEQQVKERLAGLPVAGHLVKPLVPEIFSVMVRVVVGGS